MTRRISEPDPAYGRRLTEFLQAEWDTLGVARGTWCREAGIPDSTIHRWSRGTEPNLANMRAVAAALGRPLVDILLAAGYLDPSDVRGQLVAPRTASSMAAALRPVSQGGDPALSDTEREAHRQLSAAYALVESGRRTKVAHRVRPQKPSQ